MRSRNHDISIVMSEYNTNETYLRQSIISILNQTFVDFELIIVDDCGSNDVAKIVAEFNDDRIIIVKNSNNMGLSYSLNNGIKHARGKYIVRMDTDDIAMPARIKEIYNFIISHPEYDVVGSRAVEFSDNETGGILGKSGEKTKKSIMHGDTMIHPSVIMKKSVIEAVGYYTHYKRAEDLALWCELLLRGNRLYIIDNVLLQYRVNLSDYSKRKLKTRKDDIRIRLNYYYKMRANLFDYMYILKGIISAILPVRVVRKYRNIFVLKQYKKQARKSPNDGIIILHIVGSMNRGGAETFLMNVLRNINKNKFKFVFLCYGDTKFDYENEIIDLGGKIIRTDDVKEVGILKHIKNIQQIIQDEKIDIVHTHTCRNSMFSLIAAKRCRVNTRIAHSHNTRTSQGENLIKKMYFIFAKYIINKYSTKYLACGEQAGKALFYPKNTFTVIDNGINLDDFYYNDGVRQDIRRKLNISNDTVVIGHVGRIDKNKNQNFVIDTFFEYLKLQPKSKLILVGDGILRSQIENKVRKLGIQKNVLFLGNRSDVNKLYNAFDIFIFPSIREGLPVTLVEAQTNGLTCLISDSIDESVELTDCITFFSQNNNSQQWANQLNKLDIKRKDTKKILSHSQYNMSKNIRKIESLYASALEGN
ncbi:MAG: glycosyltransferase [Candidatus Saccharibacteria bacterium]